MGLGKSPRHLTEIVAGTERNALRGEHRACDFFGTLLTKIRRLTRALGSKELGRPQLLVGELQEGGDAPIDAHRP